MTLADYSVAAFTLLNGGRIVAYLPQIIRVYRDPYRAAAVSVATWVLFAAANVATVCYALIVANDPVVALVFAMNAGGCLAIVAMTMVKRRSGRVPLRLLSTGRSSWNPYAKPVIHRWPRCRPQLMQSTRPLRTVAPHPRCSPSTAVASRSASS
jgi:hypothetical protein